MPKKREIFKVKSIPVNPNTMENPTTAQDFAQRGMAFYARESYTEAENDLRQAITLDSKDIEGHYRLGMVYKAVKRSDEAVNEFKTVIELLDEINNLSASKYEMMRRLALAHINELTQGDWNLESEIWKRVR